MSLRDLTRAPSAAGFREAWQARAHRTLVSKITVDDLEGYLKRNAPAGTSEVWLYLISPGEVRHAGTHTLTPGALGRTVTPPLAARHAGETLVALLIGQHEQMLSVELHDRHPMHVPQAEASRHAHKEAT